MNKRLYKAAYKRVLDRKYFFWHSTLFVIGNFVLFFISLGSWTPSIFYLLTLIWMRVLALHFKNTFPEVVAALSFKNIREEDAAIAKEMKRLKKEEKQMAKVAAKNKNISTDLPLKTALEAPIVKHYKDSDLV